MPFCSVRSRFFHDGDIVAVKLGQGNRLGTRVIVNPHSGEPEGTVSERGILFATGAMPASTAALLQVALEYARDRNATTHLTFLAAVHDYHVEQQALNTADPFLPAATPDEADPA